MGGDFGVSDYGCCICIFRVLPGRLVVATGFLTGHDAQSIAPFLDALSGPAQDDGYARGFF
jgi:hypothetical protein